ncbi:MAG: choice-of-anchor D domain-containing protein [Xanthomonadales bacterium]|jgi:hypothetical protein|nr:choice-of-anchor D domain-containing protein [Xanthomonadales bacterium]
MEQALIGTQARRCWAAALVATLAWSTPALAQLSGTKNIPGDYADLAAAVSDLNAQGVGKGGVILNLLAGNPQTAPAGGYTINLSSANATSGTPITLRGNGNVITASAALTAGALNDGLIRIVGEDFVTIEGFDLRENAANTTTAAATNNMTEWGIALLYRTVTDGAQNVTLRGNTITLNRTYQNTFGIYANATHTLAAPTTSATASDPAGGNSGLLVRGNTLSNVNQGIVVVGPTATANHNASVTIGGATPAEGNTISNYGTTGTFSTYANVSGSVNGIVVRNTRASEIAHNTVTSSDGGTTAGTLRGIWLWSGSTAPTGTFTQTIRNNTVSVRSGVTAGAVLGIVVDSSASSPTATVAINDNRIASLGYTLASGTATGVTTGIFVGGSATLGPLVTQINGNRFDNLSINSSGNLTLISNNFTRPANGTITANDNAIVTGLSKTLAGGTVRCYDNFGSSPATVSETNSGNNFSNITLAGTGATTLDCWRSADGATPGSRKTVSNNVFDNIENQTTGANTILTVNFSDQAFDSNVVSGNTVSNVRSTSTTATTAVIGITASSQSQVFSRNIVRGLRAAGNNAVNGISITGGTTQVLSGNRVYDLEHSGAGGTVNGILVSSGTTVNLFNNLVGDLRAPAANNGNAVVGLNISGGTAVNADYNTVRLNASSTGGLFGTSALSASTSVNLTLRNNNLVNLSTPAGTGVSAAYRRSSTTLTTYQAASNANNFAGSTLYFDGTNADLTIGDLRTRLAPRDANSISENVSFASTNGADANFLNVSIATPSQLESGGVPVAGITVDVAGALRSTTAPDIGAWEFKGQLLDLNPPSIAYTALTPTTSTANRLLAVTINDPSGVASGANAPRVYFRKNAGSYFSTACAGTAPSFECTIDNALIGGVSGGDTINYFVIAQDLPGNVGANPGAGLVATNVNTVTTPPTSPASYGIVVPVSGTINVGSGEVFTSLTNAGGLFESLNGGVLGGSLTVNITSDLSAETGAIALNQLAEEGAGAGSYTVTLRSSAAVERVISGAAVGGLLRLNGADRVSVDGRVAGAGRFLRVRNTASGPAISFVNDATANTLQSVVIESANTGTASGSVLFGAGVSSGNSNNQILGAELRDRSDAAGVPANAIHSAGTAGAPNASNTISGNLIYNYTNAGVLVAATGAGNGWSVSDNDIYQTAARSTPASGISIQGGGAHVVSTNRIGGTVAGASGAPWTTTQIVNGIDLSVALSPLTQVQGNVVRNIRSTFTLFAGSHGIILRAGAANIGGTTGNQIGSDDPELRLEINGDSYGIRVISAGASVIANNSVRNFVTSTTPVPATGTFRFGIAAEGALGAHLVENNLVDGLVNTAVPDTSFSTQIIGLFVNATGASQIRRNVVRNLSSTPTAVVTALNHRVWGSILSGTGVGTVFEQNRISGLSAASPSTGARADVLTGLQLQTQANAAVRNNYIDVDGGESDRSVFGVLDLNAAGASASYVFNTVRVRGSATGANSSWAFNRNGLGTVSLRNNIFVNARAGGTGFGVALANTNALATGWDAAASNYNLLFNADPAALTQWLGGAAAQNLTLEGFRTATGGDANSLAADPAFTGAGPELPGTSPASNAGVAVTGVTVDLFGTLRLDPPEIGAFELPQAQLGVTPATLDFGNQPVSTSSTAQSVTLANTGNVTLTVNTVGAASAPFAVSGGSCSTAPITLEVGASCTLSYTFTPTAAGAATQNIALNSTAANAGFTLSGTGVQGNLTITPSSLSFGSVNVGTTSPEQTVTLANTGNATLQVTTLTAASAPFARTGKGSCAATLPITLAAGASCTLGYTFAPTVGGAANQSLTVTANAPGSGSIVLAGTGVSGALSVSPNPAAFGNQRVGTTSAPITVTLINTGDGVVSVTALPDPSAPFARTGGSCAAAPFSLAAGLSCTVQYSFSPTVVGAASGAVVIASTPGGSNTLQLSGTGIQGNLVLPAAVNFPAQPVGTTSAPLTATLSNSGTDTLEVTALGAASAPFARTGGSCGEVPFTLIAGANCTLTYTFSPTAPGAANQSISVTANVPGSGSFTLSGTAAPSADLAIVKTSNTTLLGNGLIQYTLVVSNAGPSAVTGATVADVFAAGFSNVLWTCVGINGGGCAGSGSGDINQSVNLPVGGAVVYSITATAPAPLPPQLSNTATVATPSDVVDPTPGNNASTVVDVIGIFRNGFEGVSAQILEGSNGVARSLLLATPTLEAAARSANPELVAQYLIAGNLAVVQVRRIAGEVQAQLLTRDPRGTWQAGSWQGVPAGSSLRFEWQTGAESGGVAILSARLLSGS